MFDKMQEMLLWHTKQAPFHFQINFQYETSSLKHGPTQPSREAGWLWCGRSNDFYKMQEILRILRNSKKILGNSRKFYWKVLMYLTFSMFLKNFLEFPKEFPRITLSFPRILHFLKIIGSATPQPGCCHTTTSLLPWTAEWIFYKMQEILLWHTK